MVSNKGGGGDVEYFRITGASSGLRTDRWRGYGQGEFPAQAHQLKPGPRWFHVLLFEHSSPLRVGLVLAERGHGIDAACASGWYKTGKERGGD